MKIKAALAALVAMLLTVGQGQAAKIYTIPLMWDQLQKNAVHFYGNISIGVPQSSGTSGLYNLPEYTNTMVASYRYRSSTYYPNGSVEAAILDASDDTAFITHTVLPDGIMHVLVGGYVEWCCFDDGSIGNSLVLWYGPAPLPYGLFDRSFHHIMISLSQLNTFAADGTWTPSAQYALDGVVGDMTLLSNPFVKFGTYRGFHLLNNVDTWEVGAGSEADGGRLYIGDLAELYVDFNHREDLGPAWMAQFRAGPDGKAIGMGQNCSNPTGSIPNLCLRGDPIFFTRGPLIAPQTIAYKFLPLPENAALAPVFDSDPCLVETIGMGVPLLKRGCLPVN